MVDPSANGIFRTDEIYATNHGNSSHQRMVRAVLTVGQTGRNNRVLISDSRVISRPSVNGSFNSVCVKVTFSSNYRVMGGIGVNSILTIFHWVSEHFYGWVLILVDVYAIRYGIGWRIRRPTLQNPAETFSWPLTHVHVLVPAGLYVVLGVCVRKS